MMPSLGNTLVSARVLPEEPGQASGGCMMGPPEGEQADGQHCIQQREPWGVQGAGAYLPDTRQLSRATPAFSSA